MRDLPDNAEITALHELAMHLTGKELDEILGIGQRPDGSLAVVVYPGPKLIFSPEQVEAARAAIAKQQPAKAKQPAAPLTDPPSVLVSRAKFQELIKEHTGEGDREPRAKPKPQARTPNAPRSRTPKGNSRQFHGAGPGAEPERKGEG